MEALLVKNAGERGAIYNFNTEYLSHAQDEDGVTATFLNRITNTEFSLTITVPQILLSGHGTEPMEQLVERWTPTLPMEAVPPSVALRNQPRLLFLQSTIHLL